MLCKERRLSSCPSCLSANRLKVLGERWHNIVRQFACQQVEDLKKLFYILGATGIKITRLQFSGEIIFFEHVPQFLANPWPTSRPCCIDASNHVQRWPHSLRSGTAFGYHVDISASVTKITLPADFGQDHTTKWLSPPLTAWAWLEVLTSNVGREGSSWHLYFLRS